MIQDSLTVHFNLVFSIEDVHKMSLFFDVEKRL